MGEPAKLVLTNQFGEESVNVVEGSVVPLVPDSNIVFLAGASTPTNGGSGTGNGVADKGSLYCAKDTGSLYYNSGTLGSPTWTIFEAGNASVIAAVLTGFVAGAGTIAATDTLLQGFNKIAGNTQNKTVLNNVLTAFSAGAGSVSASDTVLGALQKIYGNMTNLASAEETISSAGALSTTIQESLINNASGSSFAVTLGAPSAQDGTLKIITLGTATHGATLAMTNIKGPGFCTLSGTTTLTFTNTGDSAILMAVGVKWMLIGGSAVAS